MKLKRVDWYPDCVRIITAQERGTAHMDQSLTHRDAARLLAGLEVALAAALREAGRGKCLRCGKVSVRENMPLPPWCAYELHCHKCGGVLSPDPAGKGE